MNINHIALKVGDLNVCEEFYSGLLGLPVVKRLNDDHGSIRSVWLKAGGVTLMLEKREKRGGLENPDGAGWHLVALDIAKEERETWKKKLSAAGVKISNESEFSLYFKDPEGNRVALSSFELG